MGGGIEVVVAVEWYWGGSWVREVVIKTARYRLDTLSHAHLSRPSQGNFQRVTPYMPLYIVTQYVIQVAVLILHQYYLVASH